MRAFAQEPKAARRAETAAPAPPARGHHTPRPELNTAPGPARPGHDFGRVSVLPPDRTPGTASVGHRFPFSAAIRRAGPAPQHDSMTAHEPEPVPNFDAAAGPAPVAGPAGPEPVDAGAVLFPAESLRAATLPDQADAIASTLGYKNSIKQEGAQPVGEFGVTRPVYAFEPPGPHADQAAGTFTVTGTVVAQITYQITTTSGRTDIASDADPDITQQNYRTVASDLTPSPTTTTVTPGGAVALYKGQPPRTRFWAADLTVNHELVHAGEDVTFGQEGVTIAQNWFNRQTAATYDDVGALLNRVTPMVVRHVDAKMALPGRELRAYDRGAADYRARAQAIKRKGDANGYAPPAPAPRAPNAPSPPARKEPAPG